MRKPIRRCLLAAALLLWPCCTAAAESYTYNAQGRAVASPDAYVVDREVAGRDWGTGGLSGPTDIKISPAGKVAVSDTKNARVIVTDVRFQQAVVLSTFNNRGREDALKTPTGLYYTDDESLYVCDQENQRILEFDENLAFVRSIENPRRDLLPEGFSFYPSAVAEDKWGTIYCIAYSSTHGYLQFDKTGEFQGFWGSPEVSLSFAQKFWCRFQTKEQRKRTARAIPVNFNNLTVDGEGFVYTTESNPNKEDTAAAIQAGAKTGLFMPVRKFNFNGQDVLKRMDFFPPAGDIAFEKSYPANEKEQGALWASVPCSIALGEAGTYYIAVARRNKIFGYDSDGRLLYAFAGTGSQTGLFSQLTAIDWHDGALYALDGNTGTVTRFVPTDYGRLLHESIALTADRDYVAAAPRWRTLLSWNQNLTLGHIGLGRASLEQKDYAAAMAYFRQAQDVESYTAAFAAQRETVMGDWFLVIPLAALGVIGLAAFAFARIGRFNRTAGTARTTFGGRLLYAQHVLLHPFDGYWDIQHEGRGSAGAAAVFLVAAAVCVAFQQRLTGFSFRQGAAGNPLGTAAVIIGAALVFCLANWCLTSLTNGKGGMRDIFTVTGYAAVPLILLSGPITLLSNVLTADEAGFVTMLMYLAYLWTAMLLFTGIMTAQQYTLGQNVLSVAFTLIGMVVIVFLAFLLFNLFGRIGSFFGNIVTELQLR